MKTRGTLAIALLMYVMGATLLSRADKIMLDDGTQVEGVIRKVEKGQVFIQTGERTAVFELLRVASMDFDTPHMVEGTPRLPAEHFVSRMEAQEMMNHILVVETAATDLRVLIDQTRKEWSDRKTISQADVPQWEAAKGRFYRPLSQYQETLNDLYFHVLGKVDDYNRLTKEANQIYVGVKGIFNIGSPLIPRELEKLPLKKYVPSNWYDTIFYEGYDRGYHDAIASEKYSSRLHQDYVPAYPGKE
jgi:hypothetical protein